MNVGDKIIIVQVGCEPRDCKSKDVEHDLDLVCDCRF